jgi:hypothetical protein
VCGGTLQGVFYFETLWLLSIRYPKEIPDNEFCLYISIFVKIQ